MFNDVMIYLFINLEKFNQLPALDQDRGAIKVLQPSAMDLFVKIVSNINLKTLTIFTKKFI